MSNIPEGWTHDLSIAIGHGPTVDELVDYVLPATARREAAETMIAHLKKEFDLTQEDAELALDRVCAGAVRAATGVAENCPSKEPDPVAWSSYHKCLKNRKLMNQIYPDSRKPWWKRFLR